MPIAFRSGGRLLRRNSDLPSKPAGGAGRDQEKDGRADPLQPGAKPPEAAAPAGSPGLKSLVTELGRYHVGRAFPMAMVSLHFFAAGWHVEVRLVSGSCTKFVSSECRPAGGPVAAAPTFMDQTCAGRMVEPVGAATSFRRGPSSWLPVESIDWARCPNEMYGRRSPEPGTRANFCIGGILPPPFVCPMRLG